MSIVTSHSLARELLNKPDGFITISAKDGEYIIVNEVPYYDSIYKGHNKQEYYKGIGIKIGDEIDSDGFVPAYELKWDIIDENKIPPCDWDKPKEINENGYYQVLEMDIE